MAGIDVNFLFTNIPQDENINICIDSFDNENENTPKIPKDIFRTLLNLATTALSFIFDKSFYKQIDGVAIGYPLSPTLCSFENKWLKIALMISSLFSIDQMLMAFLYSS